MQNTIRYGLFLLIVTGALLTGCKSEVVEPNMDLPTAGEVAEPTRIDTTGTNEETDKDTRAPSGTSTTPTPADTTDESSMYEDGTYTASGSYTSPAGPETIGVTLTIKNDLVSSVNIQVNAVDPVSKGFQEAFSSAISAKIVGKSLDEIDGYSSVNGSSLTPNGFDVALASIKTEAAL